MKLVSNLLVCLAIGFALFATAIPLESEGEMVSYDMNTLRNKLPSFSLRP
jgi:hypothetical protein